MIKSKKIFVADDDPDILDIFRLMLKTKGYDVITTSNASELFDYTDEQLPGLILLDIWMAGQDGREICERLKSSDRTKDIPVVFISANSHIREITEQYHADDYIAKPFEMDFLLNKVAYYLNRE